MDNVSLIDTKYKIFHVYDTVMWRLTWKKYFECSHNTCKIKLFTKDTVNVLLLPFKNWMSSSIAWTTHPRLWGIDWLILTRNAGRLIRRISIQVTGEQLSRPGGGTVADLRTILDMVAGGGLSRDPCYGCWGGLTRDPWYDYRGGLTRDPSYVLEGPNVQHLHTHMRQSTKGVLLMIYINTTH